MYKSYECLDHLIYTQNFKKNDLIVRENVLFLVTGYCGYLEALAYPLSVRCSFTAEKHFLIHKRKLNKMLM